MRAADARVAPIVVAIVMLAGCASTPSLSGDVAGPLTSSAERAVHTALGNEALVGTSETLHGSCQAPNDTSRFSASGVAQGPFSGAFSASGSFAAVSSRLTAFREKFKVTSGDRTISGSIVWNGMPVAARCGAFIDRSANFTYTATLMRDGIAVGRFVGSASIANRIGKTVFGEVVDGM